MSRLWRTDGRTHEQWKVEQYSVWTESAIKWAVSRNRAIVAGLKVHWIGKGWKGAIAFAVTVAMIAFQVDHNGKSGLKSKGTAMHANCYLETTHCNRDAFVLSPIKDLCCHALQFYALGQLIQLWGVFGCLLPIWIWRWFGCYRCFLLQFLNISLRYTSHVL